MVMLVQTWLGILMFAWARTVEYHHKKLEKHNSAKPPMTSQAAVNGGDKTKGVTDISE
jgi:hypothetical protein